MRTHPDFQLRCAEAPTFEKTIGGNSALSRPAFDRLWMHASQYCGGSEAIEEGLGGLGCPVCGRFEGNMVHGVFLNLIQPTICIAPWKVFLESGITRLPIRPCFTIPAATAVAV